MKNTLFAILCLFSMASFAVEPLEMDIDVNAEFAALDRLEQAVEANSNLDYETVKANHSNLIEGVEIMQESSVAVAGDQMPVLGAFWWGCCLGIVGLLIVYIVTDNDKDQMKQALIGCVIVTVLVGVGGFVNPFGWF
ncbi:hypothetical protein SAMN06298216_1377 [Spirosomataceae bacterium TFI 002]|nr:hypothetical protein SAMN06298216_1377 [Spirosomataceae bacterium TFI 002]